jgi:hypothetical protein
MIRTQIQLTEEQAARLKAVAARRGISMAEVIRQAVDSAVSGTNDRDPGARYERARRIAGKFRSGASDVSSRHDDYLAGSYGP